MLKLLRHLSITKKLLIIILVSGIGLSSVGFLGVSYINEMAKDSDEMYNENLLPLNMIMQIRVNAQASDAYTLELLVTEDPKRNQELMNEISSTWDEIDTLISKIENTDLTKKQHDMLAKYKIQAQKLAESRDKVVDLALNNNNAEAYSIYLGDVEENRAALNESLKEMQKSNIETAESINTVNKENKQEILVFVTGIIIIALIILIVLSIIISRMIVGPIKVIKRIYK